LHTGQLWAYGGVVENGRSLTQALNNPSAPVISNGGAVGATTYKYAIVCHDWGGGVSMISPPGTTTTGNAILKKRDYNTITWNCGDGYSTADILKWNGSTWQKIATNGSVANAVSSIAYPMRDTGQPVNAYTPPMRNTTADLVVAGNLSAGNIPSRLTQKIANGSLALATSSIPSGSCETVRAGSVNSAAAAGVEAADIIAFSADRSLKAVPGYVPGPTGSLTIMAYPTPGYVNFDVCNATSEAIKPGRVTLNWQVTR
jgi:hypothetical protein